MKRAHEVSSDSLDSHKEHNIQLKCSTPTCTTPHMMSLFEDEYKHAEPLLTAYAASISDKETPVPFPVQVPCNQLGIAIRYVYVIRSTMNQQTSTLTDMTWGDSNQFMLPWMTLIQALFDDVNDVFKRLAECICFGFMDSDDMSHERDKLYAIDRLFSLLKIHDTFPILQNFADYDTYQKKFAFDFSDPAQAELAKSLSHRFGTNIYSGTIPCEPKIVSLARKALKTLESLWKPDADNTTVSWRIEPSQCMDLFDDIKTEENLDMFRRNILTVRVQAKDLNDAKNAWKILRQWFHPDVIVCTVPFSGPRKADTIEPCKFICRPGVRHSLLFRFYTTSARGVNLGTAEFSCDDRIYERKIQYVKVESLDSSNFRALNWMYGVDQVWFSVDGCRLVRSQDVVKVMKKHLQNKSVQVPLNYIRQFELEHVKTHAEAGSILLKTLNYEGMSLKEDAEREWRVPKDARKPFPGGKCWEQNKRMTRESWPWNGKPEDDAEVAVSK